MAFYRTESLFHYTHKKKNLIDILKEGCLYPNYCGEDFSTEENQDIKIGIPMVCFCDIPISLAWSNSNRYGKYAIGLKKEWGIRNGCNPVQYVTNQKIINAMFYFRKKGIDNLNTFKQNVLEEKIIKFMEELESQEARAYMLGFVKKYDGLYKGKSECNYDENEWRYIIEDGADGINWMWEKGEYDLWRGAENKSKPKPTEKLKNQGLRFNLEDVNHIILPKNEDVQKFIKDLQKQMNATEKEMSILFSKITTLERIRKDF